MHINARIGHTYSLPTDFQGTKASNITTTLRSRYASEDTITRHLEHILVGVTQSDLQAAQCGKCGLRDISTTTNNHWDTINPSVTQSGRYWDLPPAPWVSGAGEVTLLENCQVRLGRKTCPVGCVPPKDPGILVQSEPIGDRRVCPGWRIVYVFGDIDPLLSIPWSAA